MANVTSETFSVRYTETFRVCRDEFVEYMENELMLDEESLQRVQTMINYTCTGGKLNRAWSVYNAVKILTEDYEKEARERAVKRAFFVGLSIEIIQGSFLVADDIMDSSDLRRGKPSWHNVTTRKLLAINDALLLESYAFFVVRKFIKEKTVVTALSELYREVILKTEIGQMLDNYSYKESKNVDILQKRFSMNTYESIVKNKTAHYSFYLPLASALILAGKNSDDRLNHVMAISMELGLKFQIQDDFLDCFADAKTLGKVGSDIEENKCTWLVVKAVEIADDTQKNIILNHYGKNNPADVAIIKKLYRELPIEKDYQEEEKNSYEAIAKMAEQKSQLVPKQIFFGLLEKIHMRKL